MPLTREQRNDTFRIYVLIGERDMPSNCTAERLVQRSGIPEARVLAALDLLWSDDAGFVQVDEHRRTGERGYFVSAKCRNKSPADIDALFSARQAAMEEADDEGDDDDDEEEPDPDDKWDDPDDD